LLLCSLPKTRDHFEKTLLYGRETLSLVEAQIVLSSKELNEKFKVKASSVGDSVVATNRLSISDNIGGQS